MIDLKSLMSGIAVVIDDALSPTPFASDEDDRNVDRIADIMRLFKEEWGTPFYQSSEMPPDDTWANLLESASFILLDWKLWPGGSSQLEEDGINANLRFLEKAKAYSVPVFIFTNEDPEDIEYALERIYRDEPSKKRFVFVQRKAELLANDSLNLDRLQRWVTANASVYALKKWDSLFRTARRKLFSSMYAGSPDWPRVFWHSFEQDGVNPSLALTSMIYDSLRGRMQMNAFEKEILATSDTTSLEVPGQQLRALIGASCLLDEIPENEIRCGDLFKMRRRKFLLNIRPDCDCIPRGDTDLDPIEQLDTVDLYCIEGRKMGPSALRNEYIDDKGHFAERTDKSIVFAAVDGKSIWFDFKTLRIKKFGDLKDRRIGRLLHPYLTRIQQRYALYSQRQGLPPIPREAIP